MINRDLVTALRRNSSYSNQGSVKVWVSKLALMAEWLAADRNAMAATVAVQAESIAIQLLGLGQPDEARRAIELCVEAGGNPPSTRNPALMILKFIFPPFTALRGQQALRRIFHRTFNRAKIA